MDAAVKNLDVSFILPTYRRPAVLQQCLDHFCVMDFGDAEVEVRVYDNGAPETSQHVVEAFTRRIPVVYTLNEPGHGLGYSLRRGASEACGDLIVELNDDALVPRDFVTRLLALFDADPRIGVVGVRAVEDGYAVSGEGIGVIDSATLDVVGNFTLKTDDLIDVEHVYGFCYAYRRELLASGGQHDQVLLARDYSSGNRIETDHCLTARRLGYRVVYDGRIAVTHLAKPRGDLSERSAVWKINHVRNTLYLYLKHFGWFGRGAIATRFALLHDVGLISLLKRPSGENLSYFLTGLRARASAVGHWLIFLATYGVRQGAGTRKEGERLK